MERPSQEEEKDVAARHEEPGNFRKFGIKGDINNPVNFIYDDAEEFHSIIGTTDRNTFDQELSV